MPGPGRRATVIYDGQCGFCAWFVRKISERLASAAELSPYQDFDLAAVGLTEHDAQRALQWSDPATKHTSQGSDAFASWLRHAGGAWGIAGLLLAAPPIRWIGGATYRIVAANRTRIPGPWNHSCMPQHRRSRKWEQHR